MKKEDDTFVLDSISLSISLYLFSPPREMVKDRKRDGEIHAFKTSSCDIGYRHRILKSDIDIQPSAVSGC